MYDIMRCCVSGGITQPLKELRYSAKPTAVIDFSIGSNSYKKGAGEYNQKSNFFSVTCFDKTAEWAKKTLVVGSHVMVDGRLSYESWVDKTTGLKRSTVKIIADSVTLIGGKKAEAKEESQPEAQPDNSQDDLNLYPDPVDPGDVPF